MAMCKQVQFNQPDYANGCSMCQFVLDALVQRTIACRCFKSELDSFNYRNCRTMKAELTRAYAKSGATRPSTSRRRPLPLICHSRPRARDPCRSRLPAAEMRMSQRDGVDKLYSACMKLGYCQDTSQVNRGRGELPTDIMAGGI